MKQWQIIDTGPATAAENMAIDQRLLEEAADLRAPTIHLYEWKGLCATYGYFTKPEEYLFMNQVQAHQLQLARRPTGGGIIFHINDLAFSVIIPSNHPKFSLNTLENYATINNAVIAALTNYSHSSLQPNLYCNTENCQRKQPAQSRDKFCMARPTIYDVMVGEKKVGGAAQRRTKAGFLHQGSISIAMPPRVLLEAVLKNENDIIYAMEQHSYSLLPHPFSEKELPDARSSLKNQLIFALQNQLR